MKSAIAVVGMACRFPDATSPSELWENVLAQRRAFRRLPRERLNAADYFSTDRNVADATYAIQAAVISGYEFDRARFRVPGSTYRQADLAHWLALDVASEALADAGYADARDLPRDSTGVLLGNTLTGEFSRANLMRLRWPYVRRVLEAALAQEDWSRDRRAAFLAELEVRYKAPFPVVGDETLAGGLSNTIAGRICNHFDLHGGGYTVDGACASSLLAVATACSSLTAGDLDVALAGGVDLSLDPFEIVGFAKIGALAPAQMRVYDRRSSGFWPGEGCGFVVLMRAEDAVAARRRIYAIVRGWGISSDGGGGLTRPEVDGQRLAVSRAYARAGYGANTVAYFEGHGTGTAIGDPIELRVLSESIRAAAAERSAPGPPAAIGSIKANIGHTKAAAGVAGFLKATLALHHQILPPTTACEQPQDELLRGDSVLRVLNEAEPWPGERAARAACSAMGFGGINTHVTLEGVKPGATDAAPLAVTISRSTQDAELFCFSAGGTTELAAEIEPVAAFAAQLSLSELTDLALELSKRVRPGRVRAAVVAASAADLASGLALLQGWLADGIANRMDAKAGVYLGTIDVTRTRRIGFLFPGQASPSYFAAAAWRRRFASIERLYASAQLDRGTDPKATEVAQPAICCAARAGLLALAECGIEAEVGIGHSVGELAALHWAGGLDADALLQLARARGQAMAHAAIPGGAMASIGMDSESVTQFLADGAVVAAMNAPDRTVISGDAAAVHTTVERAKLKGHDATLLSVSHAFHSPHMVPVAALLAQALERVECHALRRPVVSTVTGCSLVQTDDVRDLLVQQLTQPVRFAQALASVPDIDLWLEVGPGRVLAGVAAAQVETPVVALDAGSESIAGLLHACGAAFAIGTTVRLDRLFAGRFARPFALDWQPRFFVNPCELAPESSALLATPLPDAPAPPEADQAAPAAGREDPLSVFREIVAQHLELPIDLVHDASHLLTDLHLNSITVGQLVGHACRRLGLPGPGAATEYATATVGEVGQALVELRRVSDGATFATEHVPDGIDSWVRAFELDWIERPLEPATPSPAPGRWTVFAPDDHPLATPLKTAFAHAPGSGVVVCMPVSLVQCNIADLLAGARLSLDRDMERLVVVQHCASHPGTPPGGGFAKTVHLEAPRVTVRIIDVPFEHADAVRWVVAEAIGAGGFSEARYDADGRRTEPRLRLLSPSSAATTPSPLTSTDVVLVTGGGKGIAAECALALAKRTGARLAILGRSNPQTDTELAQNLARMREAGASVHYAAADVSDTAAVRDAVNAAQAALGPITAVVHGAGTNVPQPFLALDEAACIRTLQPKVQGLQNVLQAVQPERLRHLVTFSSIIGRMGLAGEADYALANEWLTSLTRRFAAEYPGCHCLALEWSVWSGAGMGQRLGRMDALLQRGVTPITVEQGVDALLDLMHRPVADPAVVVSGRFGAPVTLRMQSTELPLLRFVEKARVHYPGVELVVDVELSGRTDPYVDEHVYQRQPLFPAVMGLEAMLQVASCLAEDERLPVFESVQLQRPIVVPPHSSQRIQIAALVREAGCVEVAVRCADTNFKLDHFRAVCRFGTLASPRHTVFANGNGACSDIEPQRDLYDAGVLFHQGRFQRIATYELLRAQECRAQFAAQPARAWFAGFMPDRLLLGDAATRDAAIHAIQACIPHQRVLPVAVERILPGRLDERAKRVRARERRRERGSFVYDLEILDDAGCVLERWDGLHLKTIEALPAREHWPASLLAAYLERRFQEVAPESGLHVTLERDIGDDRQAGSQHAIESALGSSAHVVRRPDGKPELAGNGSAPRAVSVSHAGGLTFAVVGSGQVGCDIEPVTHRSLATWKDVCGERSMQLANAVARESHEDIDTAATRVWVALESLKKAGIPADAPVLMGSVQAGGSVTFTCGPLTAATEVACIGNDPTRVAVCVVAGAPDHGTDR